MSAHGDLFDIFPNASPDFLTRNSKLQKPEECSGGETGNDASMRSKLERRVAASTLGAKKPKTGDRKRFLIRVTSRRRRLIDEDNLCEKFVVDCCRHAGVLPDDSPRETKIEVYQEEVGKEGREETLIEIFAL